jgi:hypothetical protein
VGGFNGKGINVIDMSAVWLILSESGIGLPHSKTLTRSRNAPFRPRGFGVRQPYAALR